MTLWCRKGLGEKNVYIIIIISFQFAFFRGFDRGRWLWRRRQSHKRVRRGLFIILIYRIIRSRRRRLTRAAHVVTVKERRRERETKYLAQVQKKSYATRARSHVCVCVRNCLCSRLDTTIRDERTSGSLCLSNIKRNARTRRRRAFFYILSFTVFIVISGGVRREAHRTRKKKTRRLSVFGTTARRGRDPVRLITGELEK